MDIDLTVYREAELNGIFDFGFDFDLLACFVDSANKISEACD